MKLLNFWETENVSIKEEVGIFKILEHYTDLSLYSPLDAIAAYYMSEQDIHKRQVVITLDGGKGCILSSGAMQFTAGDVRATTGIKGMGDLLGKAFQGKVTGEKTVKPEYSGNGVIVTEPTFKHIFTMDVGKRGGLIVEDGMFLACDSNIAVKTVIAKTLSGALLGGEGLFNLGLTGQGIVVLESRIPYDELVEIQISKGEEVKVDGPYAVMWDDELVMSVERSGKSLVGSAVSGEGLVNVFRGEGSLWLETSAMKGRV